MGGLRYLYRQTITTPEALPSDCYVQTNGLNSAFSPVGASNTLVTRRTGTVGGMEKITLSKSPLILMWAAPTLPHQCHSLHHSDPDQHAGEGRRGKSTVWRTNGSPDIIFSAANLLNGTTSVTTSQARPNSDQPFTNSYRPSPGGGFRNDGTTAIIAPNPEELLRVRSRRTRKFSTRT